MIKIKKFPFCVFIGILCSCAYHTTFNLKELNSSNCIEYDDDNIIVRVKPFVNRDELIDTFGCDLVGGGILPVQVYIFNELPYAIGINKDNFILSEPNRKSFAGTNAETIFERAKDEYWSTAVWTAAFGVWGFLASAGTIADSRIKLDADLQSKSFKSGTIAANGSSGGIVFFEIEKGKRNLDNLFLTFPVFSRKSEKNFLIKMSLACDQCY